MDPQRTKQQAEVHSGNASTLKNLAELASKCWVPPKKSLPETRAIQFDDGTQ